LSSSLHQPLIGHYRKLSGQDESKPVETSLLVAPNNNSDEKVSKHRRNKMSAHYERRKTPNLGFVDAKESFKKDREQAFAEDTQP